MRGRYPRSAPDTAALPSLQRAAPAGHPFAQHRLQRGCQRRIRRHVGQAAVRLHRGLEVEIQHVRCGRRLRRRRPQRGHAQPQGNGPSDPPQGVAHGFQAFGRGRRCSVAGAERPAAASGRLFRWMPPRTPERMRCRSRFGDALGRGFTLAPRYEVGCAHCSKRDHGTSWLRCG